MRRGSPREDGLRLLLLLRNAGGTLVSHAHLQRALGSRAPRYGEAIMCARAHLWVEAWQETRCFEAALAASRRLESVKGRGYRLLPRQSVERR